MESGRIEGMKSKGGEMQREGAPSERCVLIADDEEALRDVLTAFLSRLGYRTKAVVNGREALEEVRSGDFDLIISDYSMPLLNGLQLYDRMCEETPAFADRFILITGTSFTSEVTRFIEEHNAHFLEKPFRLPDLQAMVEEVINTPLREAAGVN